MAFSSPYQREKKTQTKHTKFNILSPGQASHKTPQTNHPALEAFLLAITLINMTSEHKI